MKTTLKKCESCGRFFGATNEVEVLCSGCRQSVTTGLQHTLDPEEQKFLYARNKVYDFPDISPVNLVKTMVDEGIDISIKDVMGYVKQGRLILKGVGDGEYCEECGIKILSGRLCPSCAKKLEDSIVNSNSELSKLKEVSDRNQRELQSKGSRMYTQDNKKNK